MTQNEQQNEPMTPQDESAPQAAPSREELAQAQDARLQIQILKTELEKTKDQLLRALADADNTRKRAAREREETAKYASSSFGRDMLSVADNLRRALEAVPADQRSNPHMKALIEGIEATQRDLEKKFSIQGIRKIDPIGELFNPNYHEVIFEASIPGKPAGEIIQVAEVGYLLHERLLRPARVGVVKDEGQGSDPRPGGHFDTQA